MKRIVCFVALLSMFVNSNAQDVFNTISLEASTGVTSAIGISWERSSDKNDKFLRSKVLKLKFGTNYIETDAPGFIDKIDGAGFEAEIGSYTYFNKEYEAKGFFLYGSFVYGTVDYDEPNAYDTSLLGGDGKFTGTYQYFSFFAPELGYKFVVADNWVFRLSGGVSWLIEIKGKGDVDNKWFDNWVGKGALSVGYQF